MTDDKGRVVPKHETTAEALRQLIATMSPDQALPTERQLREDFGVSRTTIRQAIQGLIRQGLIYSVQGSGTYVAPPEMVSKTLRLTGFSQDMRQRGMVPSSKMLQMEEVPATEEVASRLGLEPGTRVAYIGRIRLADGAPMALEHSYVPASVAGDIHFLLDHSLYDQLAAAGYQVSRAAEVIDAVNLDAVQARHLDQAVGAAALRVRLVAYTDRGQPIEWTESIYRGDRYGFDITIARDL